jgi:pimeloyl-ACP methyl ester carboxylesterase
MPVESGKDPLIYLLPGQGADCRLFEKIEFPYDTVHLEFPLPDKKTSLHEYALGFIPRIDTSRPYILIGVSLGGMISSELADTLSPERVVIISSAKCRDELPGKYKFQRYIPINQILPAQTIWWGAKTFAFRVEPERKLDSVFQTMLLAKDPLYLKRTVNMIVNWDKSGYDSSIIHIHGEKDNTLPIKNVSCDYTLTEGTHMMVHILGEEINILINQILLGE